MALTWRQASAAEADGGRDLFRHIEPVRVEVDVVGDERHARADRPSRRRWGAGPTGRSRAPTRAATSSPRALRTVPAGCLPGSSAPGSSPPPRTDTRAPGSASRLPRPSRSPAVTQSSIVAPSIGMNGTTSTAPSRGCSPVCVRRSISATAISKSARIACLSGAGSPASVMTDRLCDASDDRSSSRAPGTRSIACTIRSTTSVRRPSLTLGTHSMNHPGACTTTGGLKASGYQLPATDYRL